jgi:hypothetical protein
MADKGTIPAHPVKSFFVEMLTRDIELQDAILDLLDNCVDGAQRSSTKASLQRKHPYGGFWAKLSLSKDNFYIEDNCGGIPWNLHEYAFRMGNAKRDIIPGRQTIGTYGIGMKRAIFKLGSDCTIETHAKDGSYRVHFSPDWLANEEDWDLKAENVDSLKPHGTTVQVAKLQPIASRMFNSKTFIDSFRDAIATHYAFIIDKGFRIFVNDDEIQARRIRLLFSNSKKPATSQYEIRPFVYEGNYYGIDIFLAIGFTKDIPSKEEADETLENRKEGYSSADAGWTIICNDRTVLYCDKTAVTGWGTSGVPQYHPQFVPISGIVVFSSDDASKLPMTTTKRGIDTQSELYLQVRDKMIEGMKIFTSYTNIWKSKELVNESREMFRKTDQIGIDSLRTKAEKLIFSKTHGVIGGKQYKPILPRPANSKTSQKISFIKQMQEIERVSKYLFGTTDKKPSMVGEECFDQILKETYE